MADSEALRMSAAEGATFTLPAVVEELLLQEEVEKDKGTYSMKAYL